MYQIFLSLLEKTGETTYQVSEATGIKSNIFSNWKNRSVNNPDASLSLRNMKLIADHFHVSVEYFLE